jgi:ATP-dependent Lhr-like helicase
MDIDLLEQLVEDIRSDKKELKVCDLREPSPLSQEILNARPYAFLDDAPAEERRTNAVINRRWLDPAEAKDLGKLDEGAIEMVRQEAWPQVSNEDELHDALILFGFLTEEEGERGDDLVSWEHWYATLVNANRANSFSTPSGRKIWISTERIPQFNSAFPDIKLDYPIDLPERIARESWEPSKALVEIIRGRLEALGPVTASQLRDSLEIDQGVIDYTLLSLEGEGFVFQGQFTPGLQEKEWCERRLLARINRYTLQKLRKEIEPVSAAEFMRYLFKWQHVDPQSKMEGPDALQKILDQLEGYESSAGSWESDILPARIKDYDFLWLDVLCLSGKYTWGKFRQTQSQNKKGPSPVKSTPISLISRGNLEFWKKMGSNHQEEKQLSVKSDQVFECIRNSGAVFFDDILANTGLFKVQLEDIMAELVSKGLITSDSFTGLRALLVPQRYRKTPGRRNRQTIFSMEQAGRWTLIHKNGKTANETTLEEIEKFARHLLKRYGVVFRRMVERERSAPPWRELVRVFRILEARGEIRGGRFVDGVWGEQYALAEAVVKLRKVRKDPPTGELITISASDPLNLTGIITPGKRISSYYCNRILYQDGVPIAFKEGKEIHNLSSSKNGLDWNLKEALIQRTISPKLRAYLGKGIL